MIGKPGIRNPVQVRAYNLIQNLLEGAKLDGSPEGRYALGRLGTKARQAEKRAPTVEKKRAQRRKAKAAGTETFSDLMHTADRVFSRYIRYRDTEVTFGVRHGHCVTCRTGHFYDELQCGHWIRRENWGTRWDERNCHAQDVVCNNYRGGEEEKHAAAIEQRHGKGTCDRLRVLARVYAKKPKAEAVQKIIADFSAKVTALGYVGDPTK